VWLDLWSGWIGKELRTRRKCSPISYLGTDLPSLHQQVLRFVLVSLERVLLRSLLKNVPHCPIPLSYFTHVYPQIEWGKEYNQVRPHSALNYRLPAPETIIALTLTQEMALLMGAGHFDYRPPAPETIIPVTLVQQVVLLMGVVQHIEDPKTSSPLF